MGFLDIFKGKEKQNEEYTEDIGIKVTEITLDYFELTDDSIAKIEKYNKILQKF